MRLSDEQVRMLFVHDRANDEARRELIRRTRAKLLRCLPSPEGVCAGGRRVRLDDKGAMSTGYAYHVLEDGRSAGLCDHVDPRSGAYVGDFAIKWDEPSGRRARLLGVLDGLRDA